VRQFEGIFAVNSLCGGVRHKKALKCCCVCCVCCLCCVGVTGERVWTGGGISRSLYLPQPSMHNPMASH